MDLSQTSRKGWVLTWLSDGFFRLQELSRGLVERRAVFFVPMNGETPHQGYREIVREGSYDARGKVEIS